MRTSVIQLIDRYLTSQWNHYVPKRLTFSPSTLSSPCLRKIFYKYLRIEPDFQPTPKQQRIFKTGDALHTMMKVWVRKTTGLIDYRLPNGEIAVNWFSKEPDLEFPVDDLDTGIKGKIDGVGFVDGDLWIFEFKSIKSEEFAKLRAPLESHQRQAMPYAFLLEKALQEGLHGHISELAGQKVVKGVIYQYLSKNNSEMKEYKVEKDFRYFEAALHSAFSVLNHTQNETLPEKTDDYCYNCEFRLACANDLNPLKKV